MEKNGNFRGKNGQLPLVHTLYITYVRALRPTFYDLRISFATIKICPASIHSLFVRSSVQGKITFCLYKLCTTEEYESSARSYNNIKIG